MMDRLNEAQDAARREEADAELAMQLHEKELAALHLDEEDDEEDEDEDRENTISYVVLKTCRACLEDFSSAAAIRVPCGHYLCHGCITRLLEKSLDDRTLFPPRCCTSRIPLKHAPTTASLDRGLVERCLARQYEHETQDKTFCCDPACGKFIPPEEIEGTRATCIWCECDTCDRCKKEFHEGICPVDEDVEETLRMANEQGWKRCPACKTVVERREGCPHITCHCGKEFCYGCLEDWSESAECPCT